ncbi:MAG: carboxypeptidase regulatory-like domain-containing protein [Planctomycetes bacterium]|nr:carboxypeptidase regulatory-like domain-containing protein [Planctomycetota bacterium]
MLRTLILAAVVLPLAAQDAAPITIQGRILDMLGDPVPVAQVSAAVGDRIVTRTASDADGVFVLSRVPATGFELRIAAAGKVERRERLAGHPKQRLRVFQLEDGNPLHGVVLDADGAPVAGADVVVFTRGFSTEVRAAADGSWSVASAPLRSAIVRAYAGSRCGERTLRLPTDARVEVVLPEPKHLRTVRVHGLPAAALANTQVETISADLALRPRRGVQPLAADSSAELVVQETCVVRIIAPGFTTDPPGLIADRTAAVPLEFTARPMPAGPTQRTLVRGRLLPPRGHPIGPTRIVAQDLREIQVGVAITDADGRFLLSLPLATGERLRLGIDLVDFQIVSDETRVQHGRSWVDLEVRPSDEIVLELEPTGGLRGTVAARDRNLRFATLLLTDDEGSTDQSLADGMGNFEWLGVPAGEYELTAIGSDGHVLTTKAKVAAKTIETITTWRPVPAGTIEGCVRDADGRPRPGVDVQLWYLDDELGNRLRHLVSDRDGRFRCRGAMAGEWRASRVGVRKAEPVSCQVTDGGIAELRLDLPR